MVRASNTCVVGFAHLLVVVSRPARIHKHLKIVVVKYDLVLRVVEAVACMRDVGPHCWVMDHGANIEKVVAPADLCLRPKLQSHRSYHTFNMNAAIRLEPASNLGRDVCCNVYKIVCEPDVFPLRVVKLAVHNQLLRANM
jgi:hypothetical protein